MTANATLTVRKPAVAGMFYPEDPVELYHTVIGYLDATVGATVGATAGATGGATEGDGATPKALIVPHAGYVYSGAVAARGYARIAAIADRIERVVLLGPAHRLAFDGLALPGADALETPLGAVPVDADAVARLAALPQVVELPAAHAGEHSLEVHLPFLQTLLGDFTLVPLVVGRATADQVAAVLEALWGGPETLIVISTDLSHYHDYETAQRMDAATAEAIEALDEAHIGFDDACGRIPVSGLLRAARAHGMAAHIVDLHNSGDTAGPRDRVVGYGAFVVG